MLTASWGESFEAFARSIERSALLVSPFIGALPLERLTSILNRENPPRIDVLTNLAPDNLIQGSTDPRALSVFCSTMRDVRVRHLPGLHAKVYVADDKLAIVTSSNLTESGLNRNYEYGIQIAETVLVRRIRKDLEGYGSLGVPVSLGELEEFARISEQLRERQSQVLASARASLRREFTMRVEAAHEALRQLRASPGEPTNSIFARTIVYLLRDSALSTGQLHPLIQRIHPDLCDDSIDRIINGVHFGKRWKHRVRSAQQSLKTQGRITLAGGRWHLPDFDSPHS